MTQRERPLSPHLQVYRFQITMLMSISHRIAGVALSVGSLGMVWWLLAAAGDAEGFAAFREVAGSWLGRLVLFAFGLGLVYHLFNGIRHMLWDAGYGFEIKEFYATGWTVLVLTAVTTAAIWFVVLGGGAA